MTVFTFLWPEKKKHVTPLQFVHKNKAVLWFGPTMSHKGSCWAFDMPSHVTLVGGGAKQKEIRQLYQMRARASARAHAHLERK